MSKKKNSNKGNDGSLVYTTSETGNAFFSHLNLSEDQESEGYDKSNMRIRVSRDRKNRGGKEVTLVVGLELPEDDLASLAKILKSKCGVGGSAKNDEIIIQGNHVEKVVELIKKEGYTDVKRSGG